MFRPPLFVIVYVWLFWSALLYYGCLFYFYFEIEGSHPSEGAGRVEHKHAIVS